MAKTQTQVQSKCDKLFELQDRTVEALLLQFNPKEIIHEGFYLPNPSSIRTWALEVEKAKKDRLQKRVADSLWETLQRGFTWNEDTNCALEDYMLKLSESTGGWSGPRIEGIWAYGFGDLFRFKPGKRKEAENEYQNYWNSAERADFNSIGIVLRDKTKQEYQRR